MEIRKTGALITGGSRGLGAALGAELAARGARVVLVARGAAELERTVSSIRAAGGEAHALVADVSDKHAVHRVAAVAAELAGPVRIVVHNASTLGPVPMPLLADTGCEDLSSVIETNVVGPFRLTKVLAGPMVLAGEGLVIHVTSDAATSAYPGWGAYGVSKAALEHLARVWAAELGEAGVRFWNVDPGEMNTAMHAAAIPDADPNALADPADVARWIAEAIAAAERWPSGASLSLDSVSQPVPEGADAQVRA